MTTCESIRVLVRVQLLPQTNKTTKMNSYEFTNWLKGYLDGISGTPTAEQTEVIKAKLRTVYNGYHISYPYYVGGYWYNQPVGLASGSSTSYSISCADTVKCID
jgi:hypothetical protein